MPKWTAKVWDVYGWKHRAKDSVPWDKIVAGTLGKGRQAKYVQGMTDAEQERIEMECVNHGIPLQEKQNVRTFYMEHDAIIGASDGAETTYVFAIWKDTNQVHGRPISIRELRQRGATI